IIKVNIKGNKITIMLGTEAKDGSFKVDETKKPKEIDLNLDGKDSLGIYDFVGDKLRICGAEPGQPRPKEIASTNAMVFVFKRAAAEKKDKDKDKNDPPKEKGVSDLIKLPPVAADDDCCQEENPKIAKTDKDLLQGDWKCVAAEKAGEKAPD